MVSVYCEDNSFMPKKLFTSRQLGAAPAEERLDEKWLRLTGVDLTLCPACGEGRMGVVAELDKHAAATARVAILDSS